MEELIALGTGYAITTKCYTTCFLLSEDQTAGNKEYFMIDTGGGSGVLTQLEQAKVPTTAIHHIFLSHAHTDHIMGAVWMIRMIGHGIQRGSYEDNLHIYCLPHIAKGLTAMCSVMLPARMMELFGVRILFHPLQDGIKETILGRETVFFDAGSTKTPQYGVYVKLTSGRTFTYLGDEPYRECSKTYAEGVDYFMHEAVCVSTEEEIYQPHKIAHSTVADAAIIAKELGVRCLILHHTTDDSLSTRKHRFTNDAKSVFTGDVWVPDDLDRLVL